VQTQKTYVFDYEVPCYLPRSTDLHKYPPIKKRVNLYSTSDQKLSYDSSPIFLSELNLIKAKLDFDGECLEYLQAQAPGLSIHLSNYF